VRLVPLNELCAFRHGGTPSKAVAAFWSGDIPWVSPKDMKTSTVCDASDRITEAAVANSATSVVPPGSTLLVVRSGILAHSFPVALVTGPVAFNQDIKAVVPKSSEVSAEYVYWFLRSKASDVVARGVKKGATVHSVQSGFIEGLQVPLVDRDEQQRIVDLLSRAEGIVRLRRQAQQKAAELIPAIFVHMFGDPATNPKGWPVFALSEVSEVISGVAKGRDLSADESIELPYMRVANVKDGRLDLDEVKTIRIKNTEVEKLRIVPGDLLMTEGGDPDKLGRAALWRGEIDLCVHQNHIFKVRSRRDRLVPEYLRSLVGSAYGKAYFLSVAKKTTGIASINKTQLSAFPVLVPPLPAQEDFRRRVEAVEGIGALQEAAAKKAEATFRSLLAKAFTETGPQVNREMEEAHA
jgi:type I restriction enzyme S subunit